MTTLPLKTGLPVSPSTLPLSKRHVVTKRLTPFSKEMQGWLSRRVEQPGVNAKLRFCTETPTLFVQSSNIPVTAMTSLFASIKDSGALIIWEESAADPEFFHQFRGLVRAKALNKPLDDEDMKAIAFAETIVFKGKRHLLCALFTAGKADFYKPRNFLRRLFRSENWRIMQDVEQQLDLFDQVYRDAKALVDRYASPHSSADLRADTVEAIVFALTDCQAGRSEKLAHVLQVAKGELTASGRSLKKKRELPSLPAGLSWPQEKFKQSSEHNKKGGIIDFLDRVWGPIIQAKLITRGHLSHVDHDAWRALTKYLHNGGGTRREMPSYVFIPPERNRKPKAFYQKRDAQA